MELWICIKSAVKASIGVIGHIVCERSVISQANNTPFKDNLLYIFTGYLPSKKLVPDILLTHHKMQNIVFSYLIIVVHLVL